MNNENSNMIRSTAACVKFCQAIQELPQTEVMTPGSLKLPPGTHNPYLEEF